MLQWMGGSRRKVTTSRKSTQKRQKQYFEQRKRQQQETAFIENNVDGLDTFDHQKRNRSLDILSLHNVSKVTEECKPLYGTEKFSSITKKAACESFAEDVYSSFIGKSGGHDFPASYHTSMSSPMLKSGELTATACTLPTGTRVPSSNQMGRVSSKSTRETSTSRVQNVESEYVKSASSIQPSIFDIIGDDGAVGISEGESAQETHVAFSIEGLGKVGTETPLQSPQRPGSKVNDELTTFTKAAKNIYSCKNINTVLDNLDMEVDVEKPSCHNRLFGDELYPIDSIEHELRTFKNGMQLDGRQCEINSFYDEDRHDIFWNDSSPCLDDYNKIDEICGVNWKNYDTSHATNNTFTWRNDLSDMKFERCYSQSPPRFQEKIPDRSDFLDGDCCFPASDEPRYSSFVCNYHPQGRFSPLKKLKDTRDCLTSFSGESCSSTAVGGESTADMPSARHVRRYGKELKDLDMPCKSNNFDEDIWNIMPTTMREGKECHSSRKQMRSGLSHLKSALFSRSPVNEREDNLLFEEEFPLPKMKTNPRSSFGSFEKSQHRSGDSVNLDGVEFHRSKCYLDRSAKDNPEKFSSEKAFHQPLRSRQSYGTSFISKADYGESSLGEQDFKVHVQSSNSSEVFGDIESAFPAPELSVQESVTEERRDRLQSQTPWHENLDPVSMGDRNMTPESRLPIQETTLKDYNGSQDTSNNDFSQEVIADADNVQSSPRTPTKESIARQRSSFVSTGSQSCG
ncbi:uncharacterized protein LOC110687799 isoform X3 [Chenopodium quinoa]|uniref:uncharacterized protein LOC110687799 isoform X3 n=1 Tax=Chenopodium quinoa TaxID=63459 RepID=UPI000B787AF1|nr:uncharacterized protein LOC110687799 isoform X3 [Chenopodium quinoa]